MAKSTFRFGFTPQEHRFSALPSTIAGIVVLALTLISGSLVWHENWIRGVILLLTGTLGIIYLVFFDLFVIPSVERSQSFGWLNALLTSIGLGILTYAIQPQLDIYVGVLLILAVITSSLITDRGPSYLMIFLTIVFTSGFRYNQINNLQEWIFRLCIVVIAGIILETVRQLKKLSRNHIRRLETVTDFSRKINSTLDTKQVMTFLNGAFQNAVEADTYFVGLREGDEMRLELIYDDGEYFENQRVKLAGSLSAWVLNNQQSLFLPDLRKDVDLPGVRLVLLGKHKTSLSWMGVPMHGENVDGIIAIGSYRPNAFDRADLELLSNLAQHAVQALQNTHHHEEVELRSQLDSLTGVYNHGNFLKILKEQTEQSLAGNQPLSLIMLDVDHFKQYNDTYGHLLGDEVLITLCSTIKQHIKVGDCVGRWGGEEFVISFPSANAVQAQHVALRIRETMLTISIHDQERKTIPVPTVSQGIAEFPKEINDMIGLIDLADKRLYIAKERGRNQIEPDPSQPEMI